MENELLRESNRPQRYRPVWWRWVLTLSTFLIAVVIAYGLDRDPADNTRPLEFDRLPEFEEAPRSTLRVGTFNIQGGKGTDLVRNLKRTSDVIDESGGDLDFVALQEVYGAIPGVRQHQVTEMGNMLDMGSLFVPGERRWWRDYFGNGILTRIQPTSMHRVPLVTTQDRKYRTALIVNIPHQGKTISILSVHLDTKLDRERQLEEIVHLFLSLKAPAVLVGDLNTKKDDPKLQQLLDNPSVTDSFADGQRGSMQGKGIDWIIARGLRFVECDSVKTVASDHPLVWAEMELCISRSSKESQSN